MSTRLYTIIDTHSVAMREWRGDGRDESSAKGEVGDCRIKRFPLTREELPRVEPMIMNLSVSEDGIMVALTRPVES